MGARPIRFLALVAAVAAIALVAGPAQATNDPLWGRQWGPRQINAEQAWAGGATGGNVVVGIVDSGVDLGHPDLAGRIVTSANCIGAAQSGACQPGGNDDNGHGTHIAGIIAANANNGIGVAGVAPGARLVVAKALDSGGGGDVADIAAGIRWVVANGAKVVNLSFGPETNFVEKALFGGASSQMLDAINAAWDAGAIPVLASGNEGSGLPIVDGSNNYGSLHAIVVGATAESGQQACYSSPLGNAAWGVVAPGGGGGCGGTDIISTYKDHGYATLAGTSMATPHVAAVAALLLGSGYDKQRAVQRILDTADKGVSCGCAGRINAGAAVGGGPVLSGGATTSPQGASPQSANPATAPTTPGSTTTTAPPSGLQPFFGPQPSPAPGPSPAPAPQPNPSPQPNPGLQPAPQQPAPPQPAPVFAPAPPPTAAPAPVMTPVVSPPVTVLPVPTTAAPPAPAPPTTATTDPPTTTTTEPPATTTTTTSATPAIAAPRRTAAPATSKALYGENRGGGSTAEAVAVASLLLGTAVTALAFTRKPPPPDLV